MTLKVHLGCHETAYGLKDYSGILWFIVYSGEIQTCFDPVTPLLSTLSSFWGKDVYSCPTVTRRCLPLIAQGQSCSQPILNHRTDSTCLSSCWNDLRPVLGMEINVSYLRRTYMLMIRVECHGVSLDCLWHDQTHLKCIPYGELKCIPYSLLRVR